MFTTRSTTRLAAAAIIAALTVTAACGSDSDAGDPSPTTVSPSTAPGTETITDDGADDDADTATDTTDPDPINPEPLTGDELAKATEEVEAWLAQSNATIAATSDACDIYEIMSDVPSSNPTNEATARDAGHMMANMYGRLAELADIDDATRAQIMATVDKVRTEADDPNLDIDHYLQRGPTALNAPEANTPFLTMMRSVSEQCTEVGN